MWTIKYVNKTSGAIIIECCLWRRYCEKRRLFLSEQEDIEILEVRSWDFTPITFLLCLFRKSVVIDYLPVSPKGEYRID